MPAASGAPTCRSGRRSSSTGSRCSRSRTRSCSRSPRLPWGSSSRTTTSRLGHEFNEPARRAWTHTLARVDDRGVLADDSAAVWPCTDQSHYGHAQTGCVVPWGPGASPGGSRADRVTRTRVRLVRKEPGELRVIDDRTRATAARASAAAAALRARPEGRRRRAEDRAAVAARDNRVVFDLESLERVQQVHCAKRRIRHGSARRIRNA